MFERFTQSARQAVILAQVEARNLGHPSIGAEHVLLGVLAERHGVGARILDDLDVHLEDLRRAVARRSAALSDAEALRTIGIDLDTVRRKIEEAFGPGALERRRILRRGRRSGRGHTPFTADAKKSLELALRESLRLKHRYIGTEHVLLGLLRAKDSPAARLLSGAGIDHATVQAHVLDQTASG